MRIVRREKMVFFILRVHQTNEEHKKIYSYIFFVIFIRFLLCKIYIHFLF